MIVIDISKEGTHIEAPSHFVETGDTIDKFAIGRFMGPVTVVTLPRGPITGEIVENYFPRNKERVILRTKPDNVFFGGAAEDVAELGYSLLGYDKETLCSNGDTICYRDLLASSMVLLEDADLENVEHDGDYYLIALPVKCDDGDSAPCRAILMEQEKGLV